MSSPKTPSPHSADAKASELSEERVLRAAEMLVTAAACWNVGEYSGEGDKKVVKSLYAAVRAVEEMARRQREFAMRRVVAECYEAFWLYIAIERRAANPSQPLRSITITDLLGSTIASLNSTSGATRAERVPRFIDSIWSDFLFAAGMREAPLPKVKRDELISQLKSWSGVSLRGQEEPAAAGAAMAAELIEVAVAEADKQGMPFRGIKTDSLHLRDRLSELHMQQVRADDRARVAWLGATPPEEEPHHPVAGRMFFNATKLWQRQAHKLLRECLARCDELPARGYVFPHATEAHWKLRTSSSVAFAAQPDARLYGRRTVLSSEATWASSGWRAFLKSTMEVLGLRKAWRERYSDNGG